MKASPFAPDNNAPKGGQMRSSTPLVFVLALLVHGCGGPLNERQVSRADLGAAWPFTIDAGVLACEPGKHVVLRANGRTYAINGSAKGFAAKNGYADSSAIISPRPSEIVRNRVERIPEGDRKRIFAAVVACDDLKIDDAIASCKARLQKASDLSAREVSLISEEGITSTWPPLTPFLSDVSDVIRRGLELCQ